MVSLLQNLSRHREQLKTFALRYRLPIYGVAAFVFFSGLYVSFQYLDLEISSLSYEPFLIIILLTQPLLILLNSFELKLCAMASKADMSIWATVYTSSSATIANILPVPAGLVLRGTALVKAGGPLKVISKVLFIAALMWIAVAMTVSGAVIATGYLSILIMLFGGLAVSLLIFYIWRFSNIKLALGFFIVRALMVFILTWQLKLCFAMLGEAVILRDAAVYVISGIAGAVISIVPAGLGVTESFGALLAKLDGASSALAYIVLSVNRLIGQGLAGVSVLVFSDANKPSKKLETQ